MSLELDNSEDYKNLSPKNKYEKNEFLNYASLSFHFFTLIGIFVQHNLNSNV